MANETTKQQMRRSSDRRFSTRWFVGEGIDIGCGNDPLSNLSDFYPLMKSVRPWDLADGDAMLMVGVGDNTYDFIHSSHCLEHLTNPVVAFENWVRICKEGGFLVITVPDEDLYEQGVWPSTFNRDHKWTFTISKSSSWSPKSINIFDLLGRFNDRIEVLKVEKLDSGFLYGKPRYDQTLGGLSESAIEIVLRKKNEAHESSMPFKEKVEEAIRAHSEGRLDEAKLKYEKLLGSDPLNLAVLSNLALLSQKDDAENYLRKALAINDSYVIALLNLADLLIEKKEFRKAKELYLRAMVSNPDDARVILGICKADEYLEDFEDALALLKAKLPCLKEPDFFLCAMAKYCEYLNKTDEALLYLTRALEINPENAAAHVSLGLQYYKKGDFKRGAENFEWAWKGNLKASQIGLFIDENGGYLRQDGKTIILCADSGLGDSIQFVRFAKPLKALGARVLVQCQPELLGLFEDIDSVDRVFLLAGKVEEAFDVCVPFHNLIAAFRLTEETIPHDVPYLKPNSDKVDFYRERLAVFPGLHVGLCWSGNPQLPRDSARSISAQLLEPLLAQEGVVFFSLQKGAEPSGLNLVDWSTEFEDMACTAALVEALDLVITVDSAIAHLAGALGRPVWLLNRFDSCWRWLEGREDSPWYPTLRQFRQSKPGDWERVMEDASTALRSLLQERI